MKKTQKSVAYVFFNICSNAVRDATVCNNPNQVRIKLASQCSNETLKLEEHWFEDI